MPASLVRHLRQNVVAYLALFLALGGTSVAAATVITGKNVKDNSLTGADVRNKSLTPRDFRGSVRGAQGERGPQGVQGPPGSPGQPGSPGEPGSDATINGVAAGGDLTGTYPNPTLAAGAVGASELGSLPGARALAVAPQTLPNGTETVIELDTESFDTGDMYAAPGDVMVAPVTGTYLIQGTVSFAGNATGSRTVQVEVSGLARDVHVDSAVGSGPTKIGANAIARVAAGAQIRLVASQSSGGNLDTVGDTDIGFAYLAAQWLGP